MAAVQNSAKGHRRAVDDPTWAKVLIVGVVMAFLALVLILPLAAVFVEALRKGSVRRSTPSIIPTRWRP